MVVPKTYKKIYGIKCEIRPTPRQIQFLQTNFGCARKVFNLYVEEGLRRAAEAKAHYEEHPDEPFEWEWSTEADFKRLYPYLAEADSQGLQYARMAYFDARNNHYTLGLGWPTFKSKWDYPRTYTTVNQHYEGPGTGAVRVHRRGSKWWLHVPKLPKNRVHDISEKTGRKLSTTHPEYDDIRIILPRELADNMRITSVTLGQRADGSYYASLSVEETVTVDEDPEGQEERDYRTLASLCFGGDLGLKSYLAGTDGTSHDDPGDYGKLEEKYKREQRKLGKQRSRLQKQGRRLSDCRNYQKQKRRVAKIARKIARKREDFRHKLSRQLVDSFDLIALEDLHVVGMLRNHHLAKAVSEAAWSDFINKVLYKAEWAGKTVVLVSQWYPSTRTCSCCGAKTGPHGAGDLGIREWVCPECGAHHDRDGNASWNILLEGLRVAAAGGDEMAPVWGQVYELVLKRHQESFEPVGRVATAPTVGTAGVAWGKDEGSGSPASESYLGVYTEPAVAASGRLGSGLGEPGVSKNSQGNREQVACLPSGGQARASR